MLGLGRELSIFFPKYMVALCRDVPVLIGRFGHILSRTATFCCLGLGNKGDRMKSPGGGQNVVAACCGRPDLANLAWALYAYRSPRAVKPGSSLLGKSAVVGLVVSTIFF